MAGYRGTHPRYLNMVERWEVENEEWREFPMMVYPGAADPRVPEYQEPGDKGYKPGSLRFEGVIVQDEEELEKVIAGDSHSISRTEDGLARASTSKDEHDALLQEAANISLKVDRKWSPQRLRDAIDTAKADKAAAQKAKSTAQTSAVV